MRNLLKPIPLGSGALVEASGVAEADGTHAHNGDVQAIPGHARACSGRLLGRRRELVSRGLMPCKANTATAAEMARMLLYIGRDAQEAAAPATEVARAA